MKINEKNYAFIDSQNVFRGIKSLGWKLNWFRFRVYLKDKYQIETAFLFIGYIPEQASLYADLQKAGFVLVFKPVLPDKNGHPKGNVDADLVLQAMIEYGNYDKAVIATSDGDFYSLVKHLKENGKLKIVLSPYKKTCSSLLKKSAQEQIVYMDNLKEKIGIV